MQRFLRNNGLTLTYMGLFLGVLFLMSVTGHRQYNDDQRDHQQPPGRWGTYLHTGDFVEGVFENWESEFLQAGTYVLFSVFLFQKGSPESKPRHERSPQDVPPERQRYPDRPWAVRRGGAWLKLYMNSLTIGLFGLFGVSLSLHALGGTWAHNENQMNHGGTTIGILRFMTTSEFWYQSLQNWQSEFLAVASLAFLSIYLRQHGSPESKPVAAPHSKTGA